MDSPPLSQWQISSEGRAWHIAFAEAIASRDVDRYVAFMTDDCWVQINNAMPVYSKRAITAAFQEYVKGFRAVTFELLNVFGTDHASATEALFTYACNDGSTEVVQHCYVIDRNDEGLITSVRVYGDTTRILKSFMRAND